MLDSEVVLWIQALNEAEILNCYYHQRVSCRHNLLRPQGEERGIPVRDGDEVLVWLNEGHFELRLKTASHGPTSAHRGRGAVR